MSKNHKASWWHRWVQNQNNLIFGLVSYHSYTFCHLSKEKIQIISSFCPSNFNSKKPIFKDSYRATQFKEIDTIAILQNVCLESLIRNNRSLFLTHYKAYSFLWRVLGGAAQRPNNVGPEYINKRPLGAQPRGS